MGAGAGPLGGVLALAGDLERAVVEGHVEGVAVDARQVEREEVGVVGLGHVGAGAPDRLGTGAVARGSVVEEAVHLPAQDGEVAAGSERERRHGRKGMDETGCPEAGSGLSSPVPDPLLEQVVTGGAVPLSG